MSLASSLGEALHDRYVLERELGRGGMATVYLAHDLKHDRPVALKVLHPELAATLGPDRFQREIRTAARLQHPHILGLHDSGETAGQLWFTMPYVEGETLRERLRREGELPTADAVRIIRDLADALAYAHPHGVVHRDIKPENVILTARHAVVMDFGVAKAVSEAAGGPLTSVGLALGTPAYMAPEQAAADPTTDHRADLYALGVVAYEMLAGQLPFSGRTTQQLLAAHATEWPVPLRDRRPAVPSAVADVVMRLLEKRAADRPQGAEEVLRLLEAAATPAQTPATIPLPADQPEAPRRARWMVVGGLVALGLALSVASLSHRRPPAKVDRTVVAVAPFRVSGADSSLAYLREGMVDLLAAKLSGTAGLRAADPRMLLVTWRRAAGLGGDLPEAQAVEVAERVGAGRLIEGDVVGTRQQITVNAAVLDAPGARVRARASVEGSPDSLPRLVDRLAAKLLALEAGEGEQRLGNLTSTSLPALRAYLDGQALVRRGRFAEAADKFKLALQQDSTFALAGLGLDQASGWGLGGGYEGPGMRMAWRYRDKLSPRDRALLDVGLGTRWPAPRLFPDGIRAAERFVRVAPDDPEAWYELGDNLYHWGPLVGITDAHRRATEAFSRATALDSSFAPALEHGATLALALGDTAGARRALKRLLRVDSTSVYSAALRWQLAMSLGDSAGRRLALRSDSLSRLASAMQWAAIALGTPLQDADSLFRLGSARAVTVDEQSRNDGSWHINSLIIGQPSRAVALPGSLSRPERDAYLFLEARFADGDSAAGAAAGAALERQIGTPLDPRYPEPMARYAAGQSALDRSRIHLAEEAAADLRHSRVPADSAWLAELPTAYALILEAQLAGRRRSHETPRLLAELDSAMTNLGQDPAIAVGNLVLARLYEERGNLSRALAAIRRRAFDIYVDPTYVTYYRQEGRLAALNGDREGAIRAYRRYLGLRSGAEPRLQPQVAQVRAELDALERESTDR